jgi:hypothetical protein
MMAVLLLVTASARADVVEQSGVRGGLVVILAGKDANRIAELAPSGPYLTQILLQDEKLIAETRKTLLERNVYGAVSVRRFDGRALPYVDNLANVIIVSKSFPVPREELMRVLAPRGALLVCKGVEDTLPDAASPLADGDWFVHHKPVPEETDEWTHFRYDATGNMVSLDTRIAPPRYTQWISGPRFQRHHGMIPSITASVTSGGRIFYIIDEAPNGFVGLPEQWHVVARDALQMLHGVSTARVHGVVGKRAEGRGARRRARASDQGICLWQGSRARNQCRQPGDRSLADVPTRRHAQFDGNLFHPDGAEQGLGIVSGQDVERSGRRRGQSVRQIP